jgi:Glyoxalase superfamily protein
MSRHLPQHPNLEYLKKQAKESLRDMRRRNPAFKLADAQHAIAREYGFSNWPKLKAHVSGLTRDQTSGLLIKERHGLNS